MAGRLAGGCDGSRPSSRRPRGAHWLRRAWR